MSFEDLLAANRTYASHFPHQGFDGIARKGVLMVTCMDSRIDPLDMIGLGHGDAKILRTPGGVIDPAALTGCILGVNLLQVDRILLVPHTKCAMASGTDDDLRKMIEERHGLDTTWLDFGASPDQLQRLRSDFDKVSKHPLIRGRAEVGGFMFDVDTGALEQLM